MDLYKSIGQPYRDGTSFADVDVKKGKLSGYFSSYDIKDADDDIIRKGAYAKTISEMGPKSSFPRTKHLIDHEKKRNFARIDDLLEDDFGLKYYSTAGKHDDAVDFLKKIDSGLITEHSVHIVPIIQRYDDMLKANIITECKLWEGSSLHCWGSNWNTPFTEKSLMDLNTLYSKLKSALTSGTYTDKSMQEFQSVYDKIGALLKTIKQPDPEEEGTTGEKESQTPPIDFINIFKNALNGN